MVHKIHLLLISLIYLIGSNAFAITRYQFKSIKPDNKTSVDLYTYKDGCKKVLLVLPGYRHSRKRLQNETSLIKLSDKYGYCLVLPDMMRSVYESTFTKYTKRHQFELPTELWFEKLLFPYLQKKESLYLEGQKLFILGISTGGRGAALMALRKATKYVAVASLSGDFNQLAMKKDFLMRMMYGKYNAKNWQVDNPTIMASALKIPYFIGHGKRDKTVPFSQSKNFYLLLKKKHPQLDIKFVFKNAGHNYKFWNSLLPDVFDFFAKVDH